MDEKPSKPESDVVGQSTEQVRNRYDWGSTSPATAVIETVARATNRDATALAPLYSRVDPDALDAMFEPGTSGRGTDDLQVSFSYADREVTVASHGAVTVTSKQGFW